jgi:hypothetical protein
LKGNWIGYITFEQQSTNNTAQITLHKTFVQIGVKYVLLDSPNTFPWRWLRSQCPKSNPTIWPPLLSIFEAETVGGRIQITFTYDQPIPYAHFQDFNFASVYCRATESTLPVKVMSVSCPQHLLMTNGILEFSSNISSSHIDGLPVSSFTRLQKSG